MAPRGLLPHALLQQLAHHAHVFRTEQLGLFFLQLQDDIAEQPQMGVLVPVDIADLLCGAGHLAVAAEVVEKHEAGVEIHAFQNVVRHQRPE